jgi:putative lipase involved disintegration of autophagic bodies
MDPVGEFRPAEFRYSTGYVNDGFWGCLYVNETTKEVVVAFKGTGCAKLTEEKLVRIGSDRPNHSLIGDITADLKLLIGIIPNQASTAETLFTRYTSVYDPAAYAYSITGHSLGGYLAQVVSYWYALPCVTFNAPGAWGDMQKAKINAFKPQVMWQSIKATFQFEAICVNFIHVGDIIGNYGLHRGRTNRLQGFSHAIKDIRDTIAKHERWSKCSPFDTRTGILGLWDRF